MNRRQVFYEILRADDQPFADERDKKKFLDLIIEVKKRVHVDIFAFCITDEEGHFLVSNRSARILALAEQDLLQSFSSYYGKRYQKTYKGLTREMRFRKYMTDEEIMYSCLKLHLIPMKRKLARSLEDYWWSSYMDYWKQYKRGIVNTDLVLRYLDPDCGRAVRKFVNLHHTLYRIHELESEI